MTHHTTIIAGRSKRLVRVEHKRGPYTRAEIDRAALTAVGDALFRLGGTLSGRDVLRILTERKGVRSEKRGNRASEAEIENAIKASIGDLSAEKPGRDSGRSASSGVEKGDIVPGPLAADVSRLIRPDRQRQFGAELWLGGVL